MLPCDRCQLQKDGCNNCNHFSAQCSRFKPFWTDRKTFIVSQAPVMPSKPVSVAENPMLRVMIDMALEELNNA